MNNSKPIGKRGKPRFAFTLIEILLACVLASMLSVVMIQILRTTLVESRRAAQRRQPLSETWLLREQISNDLSNARGFKINSSSLSLGGFLARDPGSGARNQQMAIITYQLVPTGSGMALQRSESLFSNESDFPTIETVWLGVGGMIANSKSESIGIQSNSLPELDQMGFQSIAGGVSFRLVDSQGKLLVEIL